MVCMSKKMYDELALESAMKESFGIDIDIRQLITLRLPVDRSLEATLFLTTKKQLYLYIAGPSKVSLGDIKKIVSRMGLRAELFIPPKGRPHYFEEIGIIKFHEVFPGRKHVGNEDISFYKTLANYNPALVLINEVKDGVIYQFDSDSKNNWRIAAKFSYKRIKTS